VPGLVAPWLVIRMLPRLATRMSKRTAPSDTSCDGRVTLASQPLSRNSDSSALPAWRRSARPTGRSSHGFKAACKSASANWLLPVKANLRTVVCGPRPVFQRNLRPPVVARRALAVWRSAMVIPPPPRGAIRPVRVWARRCGKPPAQKACAESRGVSAASPSWCCAGQPTMPGPAAGPWSESTCGHKPPVGRRWGGPRFRPR
jgi:hypothetical protein